MDSYLRISLSRFVKHSIGLVTRPYETCRDIADHGTPGELLFIAILLCGYFGFASLVKIAAFRPFLLTRQFLVLVTATGATYLVCIFLFWLGGIGVKAKGAFRSLATVWGYSLIPTWAWFVMTSLLYVLLPPPRSTTAPGVAFSMLFLVCSLVLLFWKITIGYLSLRFGLRLSMGKIIIILLFVLPLLCGYSIGMYRLGIFKVPFI